MKEWYLAKEIAGLSGVPSSPSNVTRLGTQKNWQKRQVEGAKGVTYEYHLSSLPPETQQALRLQAALAEVKPPEMAQQKPSLDLVRKLNQASDAAREKAKAKTEACLQLKQFLDQFLSCLYGSEGKNNRYFSAL